MRLSFFPHAVHCVLRKWRHLHYGLLLPNHNPLYVGKKNFFSSSLQAKGKALLCTCYVSQKEAADDFRHWADNTHWVSQDLVSVLSFLKYICDFSEEVRISEDCNNGFFNMGCWDKTDVMQKLHKMFRCLETGIKRAAVPSSGSLEASGFTKMGTFAKLSLILDCWNIFPIQNVNNICDNNLKLYCRIWTQVHPVSMFTWKMFQFIMITMIFVSLVLLSL